MSDLLRRLRASRDDGFTLVELLIATGILSLILLGVGGLMFSTTVTQRTVTAVSQSASSAQTAADEIHTLLRNAAEFRLTAVDGTDQLLLARVAGTGTTASYTCKAWYYAADEHQLRSSTWPVAGSTTLPTSATSVAGWSLLLDGVGPRTGTTVFAPPVGGTIEVAFEVESDDRNEPTAIQFTAALAGGPGGGTTCWD
ncbi:PilW family protein [Pseudolysinimonas sp.]|uniref:PilW family protein n=1 Tax=Pseudolysinimonas sp. TaxID=2680009 RepID=UPI0037846020